MTKPRGATPFVLLLCTTILGSCVDVRRRATASVDEYAVYRRFRTADSVEHKLAASFDYLRRHPDGAWREEVSRWFFPAERAYVRSGWDDLARLGAFVKAVPSGQSADEAERRIVELELAGEYRARSDRAFNEHASRIEERLARAEAGRHALISGVAAWVRRLSSIRSWGGRTSDLDTDFIFAYRLSEPEAHCDDEHCTKTVTVDYEIPEGKAQSEREAVYDVGLRLEHGGVRAAFLSGSELFTRLGEAVRVAAVTPTDLVARAEAIGQATQMIALAAETAMPASRCAAEAVSPVVLRRVCDGVELRAVSAVELGEEDQVTVAPVADADRRQGSPSNP